MRYFFLGVLLLIITEGSYSQVSSFLEFSDPSLFNGKGYILNDDFSPKIILPVSSKFIRATPEQVYVAELIFMNKFSKNTTLLYYNNKNIKKYFWHYNRQYLGFQDKYGQTNIIINLLNFKNKRISGEKFENWEKYYFIGFGQFYERNTLRVKVNIDSCKVDVW